MSEVIETLPPGDLKVVQKEGVFRFGIDAVLLSHFARARKTDRGVDLCSGNAIIPLLMTGGKQGLHFTAVEIQKEIAELAEKSVRLNSLEEKITVLNADLNNIKNYFEPQSVEVVTCNPPYIPFDGGTVNPKDSLAAARHEVFCTLEEVVRAASYILKPKGSFYMIHKPERLCEIISSLRENKLEPKLMQLVQPSVHKEPNMVLLQAVKTASSGLRVKPTLNVYEEGKAGVYTKEINEIYGRT